jgi:hypothetical protein
MDLSFDPNALAGLNMAPNNGLFSGFNFADPRTQGLLSAAAGILAASGPSRTPTGIGQALGQGLLTGTQAFQTARHAQNLDTLQKLQAQQAQVGLDNSKRTQAAIDAYAQQLPPEKRGVFLADPAAFIKAQIEPYTLSPGQKRMTGNTEVASVPPNLVPLNLGGTTAMVRPDTGQAPPGVAPLAHTMTPGETATNAVSRGNLLVRAAEADPFGMLGIRDIAARAAAEAYPEGRGGGGAKTIPASLPSAQGAAAVGSGLTGDEFLKTVPKPMADQVKALAEGRMAFPGGFALKSPYWQNMISMVSQYDPNFDAVNYNARASTRKDFTSGKSSQSLNALNTVMGHLDELEKSGASLGNTSFPLYNQAANYVTGQVSPEFKGKLNSFNLAKQAVSSEMERAYRGTGGNMTEIEAWKKTLDSADSPTALRESIKMGVKLLESKINALGETYNKGMGTTSEALNLLDPKARATFSRLIGEDGKQSSSGKINRQITVNY